MTAATRRPASGVELGGGVAWSDPALGLSLDVSGRTLIAHGNDDLEDRGYAVALAFDPDPATQRGPSLSVRQEFGGQAQGGLDALFQPATLADRTGGRGERPLDRGGGLRLAGLRRALHRQPACGPRARRGCARLQPRLAVDAGGPVRGERLLRPEGDPQGRATQPAPEHTVGVEMTARW